MIPQPERNALYGVPGSHEAPILSAPLPIVRPVQGPNTPEVAEVIIPPPAQRTGSAIAQLAISSYHEEPEGGVVPDSDLQAGMPSSLDSPVPDQPSTSTSSVEADGSLLFDGKDPTVTGEICDTWPTEALEEVRVAIADMGEASPDVAHDVRAIVQSVANATAHGLLPPDIVDSCVRLVHEAGLDTHDVGVAVWLEYARHHAGHEDARERLHKVLAAEKVAVVNGGDDNRQEGLMALAELQAMAGDPIDEIAGFYAANPDIAAQTRLTHALSSCIFTEESPESVTQLERVARDSIASNTESVQILISLSSCVRRIGDPDLKLALVDRIVSADAEPGGPRLGYLSILSHDLYGSEAVPHELAVRLQSEIDRSLEVHDFADSVYLQSIGLNRVRHCGGNVDDMLAELQSIAERLAQRGTVNTRGRTVLADRVKIRDELLAYCAYREATHAGDFEATARYINEISQPSQREKLRVQYLLQAPSRTDVEALGSPASDVARRMLYLPVLRGLEGDVNGIQEGLEVVEAYLTQGAIGLPIIEIADRLCELMTKTDHRLAAEWSRHIMRQVAMIDPLNTAAWRLSERIIRSEDVQIADAEMRRRIMVRKSYLGDQPWARVSEALSLVAAWFGR